MHDRSLFLVQLRDPAGAAAYERFAREVDYPYARSQSCISGYEMIRADTRLGPELPSADYVEILELADATDFETLYTRPAAADITPYIMAQLRMVGGYVGEVTLTGGSRRERTRAVLFAQLADVGERGRFEEWLATTYVPAVAAADGISRVEIVRLDRQLMGKAPMYHYATILDLADPDALSRGERPQSPVARSDAFGISGPVVE